MTHERRPSSPIPIRLSAAVPVCAVFAIDHVSGVSRAGEGATRVLVGSKRARVPDETLARARAFRGRAHLLVLLEDGCGDTANVILVIAKLADAVPGLDLRDLRRDEYRTS